MSKRKLHAAGCAIYKFEQEYEGPLEDVRKLVDVANKMLEKPKAMGKVKFRRGCATWTVEYRLETDARKNSRAWITMHVPDGTNVWYSKWYKTFWSNIREIEKQAGMDPMFWIDGDK